MKQSTDIMPQLIQFESQSPTQERQNGKTLVDRALGRFYTHELIGRRLARAVCRSTRFSSDKNIKIAEPFCGDGRLVCWLLEEIATRKSFQKFNPRINISIWDNDASALTIAVTAIRNVAKRLKLRVTTKTVTGDSFSLVESRIGRFDIVITNPPWEILKPDRRELLTLTTDEIDRYKTLLRKRDKWIAEKFPLSQPIRKFSGWGTNLARSGLEAAIRITRPAGVCGVVSPASLLGDQMSTALRKWIFNENNVSDLAYYPAEARLFKNVDQAAITIVASPGRITKRPPSITLVNSKGKGTAKRMTDADWSNVKQNDYILPLQFGINLISLSASFSKLPKFSDLENKSKNGLWAGRELDETGHTKYLSQSGSYLFCKGRMIRRYGILEPPSRYVKHNGPNITPSADHHRIAWRDVSRPSQKRRIHATIIPSGWVTGNSLHVAYFHDDNLDRLRSLLAIFNSFVFEWLARSFLSTGHISLGAVRRVPIPKINSAMRSLLADNAKRATSGDDSAVRVIDVCVAKLYGLSKNQLEDIISQFDLVPADEREAILSLWNDVDWAPTSLSFQEDEIKIPNHYDV